MTAASRFLVIILVVLGVLAMAWFLPTPRVLWRLVVATLPAGRRPQTLAGDP